MTQVTKDMETVRLKIPEVFLNYNWDEAINAKQGETAKLLEICKAQSETLRKSIKWPSTPEILAWLTLWTRNFNLLQGAISILESHVGIAKAGQTLALRILWRPAFELWVTLNFISSESAESSMARSIEKQTLEQRLCGYLAWCLWNDKEFTQKLTQGRRLDTLFGKGEVMTPETEKKLNRVVELFWGDEKGTDSRRDQKVKQQIRKNSLYKRNQLLKWLDHKKLYNFVKQIKNQRPSNYFMLIDPENKSLPGLLRSSWNDAGYPAYQEASTLIHGSTFEGHIKLINEHIYLRIAESDEVVQQQASHVRRFCNFNGVSLGLIQNRMEREGLTEC